MEIGAGAGWQAEKMIENGYKVHAIDVKNSNFSDDRIFYIKNYDGRHIPYQDGYFDLIFSSNVMEHIPHLKEFHHEMQRVLKSDGIAIHILPSAYWRFYTNIAHYPFILISVIKMIYKQITPRSKEKINTAKKNIELSKITQLPTMSLVRKIICPSRHGETGTIFSEIYYFSQYKWSMIFREGGWQIKKITPNRLFYTGYMIFGSLLSLQVRNLLSYCLGSSCLIFVLGKKK